MVINIACHILLEVPGTAITAIRSGFHGVTGNFFSGVTEAMISMCYEQQHRPIFKEICSRPQLESTKEGSERVFTHLINLLREHRDDNLLHRFPHYSTASPNNRGDAIRVSISSSHATCFLSIEFR